MCFNPKLYMYRTNQVKNIQANPFHNNIKIKELKTPSLDTLNKTKKVRLTRKYKQPWNILCAIKYNSLTLTAYAR